MRTKQLYLAAAALLGGLLTASAQSNVYSLNIVGYVNVEVKNGYNMVANPLNDGNGNNSTNLVPSTLPVNSQVLVFDPVGGYTTSTKKATGWTLNFVIPPGKGYFVRNLGTSLTNTYVGSVAGSVPGSLTNSIAVGYNMVGSPYPIGGNITNTGSNTLNIPGALAINSQILTFDPVGGYTTSTKKATGWTVPHNMSVGQGFFIRNVGGSPVSWTQDVGP